MVCFNVGIVYCASCFYKFGYEGEKSAGYGSSYTILTDLNTQMEMMRQFGMISNENIQRIFSFYGTYITYRNNPFFIYQKGELVYTNHKNKNLDLDIEGKKVPWETYKLALMKEIKDNNTTYLAYKTNFTFYTDDAIIIFLYPINEFFISWKQMVRIIAVVEIVISLLLFVGLIWIIKYRTKPIVEVSLAANKIAQGDYSRKIKIKGKDEIASLAHAFNDMSQKVEEQIVDLQAQGEQKQRFIDNLGHELRTPLTTISGYAQFLQMAVVSEEEKYEYLTYIVDESHRLLKLSSTLLELAVLRNDEIEFGWVQTSKLEEMIKVAFEKKMEEKDMEYQVEVTIPSLYSNEELLYSLCSNLIENAYRACREGGKVSFTMEECLMKEHSMERHQVLLTVTDDGIGLSEEDITKITEPFYRVDKDRSRSKGGVGLGTTLCQQIVTSLGGTITYESVLGKGTTVKVIL